MALPFPPGPGAPSAVNLEYNVAGRLLHTALYLQNLGSPQTTAGLPDRDYADPNNVLWGLFESTSAENLLSVTLTNFLANILPLYDPDTTFNVKSAWQRPDTWAGIGANDPMVELFPTPAITGKIGSAGAGTSPTSDEPGCFIQKVLTARGSNGGRFRLTLVGAQPTTLAKRRIITPDSGGDDYEKLVAYLISSDCRILAHDGGKPTGTFVLHTGPSVKLRRSNNFA